MPEVATFTRVYPHGDGLEHQATPQFVANVIQSMTESQDSTIPFKVRLRMTDGSVVLLSPKRRRPLTITGAQA